MSAKNRIRVLALLAALAMVAAACGQKEGVHVGFAGGVAGGGAGGAVEGFVDADGDGIDDNTNLSQEDFASQFGGGSGGTDVAAGGGGATTGGDTSGGSTGGATTAGTTTGGGSGGSGDSGGGGGGGGGGDGGGGGGGGSGDSTGVSASTLKIGIHAPLTGAAPIPSESFRSGKDQYWKNNKVAGRKVEVVFRDDKYNPSTASQVCQELILKEKVFLLTGSGGTDQIVACARVAAQHGVPYLSAGVTEKGLAELSNYWTLSKSYSQQMPLLMQMIKKDSSIQKPAAGKLVVGIVASNTANFDDAVAAYQKAAAAAGFTPKVYRPSKEASTGELQGVATRMASDNVAVGTPVMAPTQWIELVSDQRIRGVAWRGIGITQGLNTVARAACASSANAINGSAFFSPWPGFNMADQIDKKFKESGGSDDIQWGLWGLNKTLHAAFAKMGNNLTRGAFNKAMTGGVRSGVYPDLAHSASNHFGATSVHVLRADCSAGQFKSQPSDLFRKGF